MASKHFIPDRNDYYDRISHIANKGDKGDGFLRWAVSFPTYKDMESERDQKAEEGKQVHEIVRKLVAGERIAHNRLIPEIVWNKAESFREWWEKEQPTALFSEELIYHDGLKIAGHPDLGLTRNGRDGVVDIKSGSGPFPGHVLQVEAYCRILEEEYDFHDLLRQLLFVDQKGHNLIEWEADDAAWEAFQGLLNYSRFEESLSGMGKKRKRPLKL